MPGLGTSFGRGAMTNHWIDVKNADVILIIGSNCAENHPAAFAWITEAMERGTRLIVVDPRINRTAAKADIYAPLRSGTDIAFIGYMINYILQNELYHKEYVLNYTNAATLINPNFKSPADLDGLFSGYDAGKRSYDRATWTYQREKTKVIRDGREIEVDIIKTDPTLQHPNCVFQLLKKHYARYTADKVSAITGCPKDKLEEVAKAYAESGKPGKSGTLIYAMGGTQHTVGTQNVRSYAILQLLLGNIGVAGGGVNALRGAANVQGATDVAVLYHDLPGYLGLPTDRQPELATFQRKFDTTSFWSNGPRFFISLLKAWWGERATKENDYAYNYLPKSSGDYSWIPLFEAMNKGTIKGLIVMGQNPAICGPNQSLERAALQKLEWMVVLELFDTETSGFWKREAGVNPATIGTEVFLLPAVSVVEKEGSVVNSGRMIQWRRQAVPPRGQAKHDLWILDQMFRAVRALYQGSPDPKDRPILDLLWDYGPEADAKLVAREINGYAQDDVKDATGKVIVEKGKLIPGFATIATAANPAVIACGCWIHSGYFAEVDDGTGKRMPACMRRNPVDPSGLGLTLNWGFAWPANRRILYNRASSDPAGRPWNDAKKVIWWDAAAKSWKGYDVPDFPPTKAPDAKAVPGGVGLAAQAGTDPFIMRVDGKGGLFGPLAEGAFPEHYEPLESPINNPMSSVNLNPVVKVFETRIGTADKFPIVATTYRLAEHYQSGAMSRNLPWLAELQPNMFVEVSRALAREKGFENGDTVEIVTARGSIKAVALVTNRFQPFRVDGRVVHHIGMPWHFGWQGIATGDSANFLTPHVGDGNTTMPEYKAFLCDIRKA